MRAKDRAALCASLAGDLAERVAEKERIVAESETCVFTGYQYPKGAGLAGAQLSADIRQLRRHLALLDKEIR